MVWKSTQVKSVHGNSSASAQMAPQVSTFETASGAAWLFAHHSVIGTGVVVAGEISGNSLAELVIEGTVEGDITLPGARVIVGPNGRSASNISAANVVLFGKVAGTITATDRIEIPAGGSLTGNAKAPRIKVEDGAFVVGKVQVLEAPEMTKPAAASTDIRQAASSSAPAVVTSLKNILAETPRTSRTGFTTPIPIPITALKP